MLSGITTAEILDYVSAALFGLTILGMRNEDENVAKFALGSDATPMGGYSARNVSSAARQCVCLLDSGANYSEFSPAHLWQSRLPSTVTVETFSEHQCQTLERDIAAALQAPHRSRFKSSSDFMKVCRRFAGEPGAGKIRCILVVLAPADKRVQLADVLPFNRNHEEFSHNQDNILKSRIVEGDNMAGSTSLYPIIEPNAAYLVFKQRGLSRAAGTPSIWEHIRRHETSKQTKD
ncbi:hypothetical protein PG990_009066 [Apiospora arundinis]